MLQSSKRELQKVVHKYSAEIGCKVFEKIGNYSTNIQVKF